jgi:hypothetical protein
MLGWGPLRITQIASWDTLNQTCVFSSGGIYGSRSMLWCVRGVKQRCTIFHSQLGPRANPAKSALGHAMPNLCFGVQWDLQVMQCVLVHSGRETSMHYFMLRWARRGSKKACRGTLCRTCVFASSVIYGALSAFWYVWDSKR